MNTKAKEEEQDIERSFVDMLDHCLKP